MNLQLAAALFVLACAALVAPFDQTARTRLPDRVSVSAVDGRGQSVGAGSGLLSTVDGSGRRAGGAGSPSTLDGRGPRRDGLPLLLGIVFGLLAAIVVGGVAGLVLGVLLGTGSAVLARRVLKPPTAPPTDPTTLAGAWDLLAASLRCGLPVATAVRAIAGELPGADGGVLRRIAELLALGADPATAWQPGLGHPSTAGLAAAAIRTARSGAAMADAVTELAANVRAAAADLAETRAQRVAVLVTAPLGLCFLPAFVCLGVAPVVIGLASELLSGG